MIKFFTSCLLLVSHFTPLLSLEKSYIFEGSTKGSMILESAESKQEIAVQNYSLKNISENAICGVFLSINANREKQKKQISQLLIDKNNLWKWWKQQHPATEEKGAYSSLVGSTLRLPSRDVPAHGTSLREFFFNDRWHLIDDKQNLIYLALDNHTVACYEDVADEPFLALRTKVTGLEGTYNFAKACSNFAHLDIFPTEFDCNNPSDEELQMIWKDYHFDLYPHENLLFHADGTIEQTIILEERLHKPGVMNIGTGFPITQIVNNSESAVRLEDQNFLLEPNRAYDFAKPIFSIDVNSGDNTGKLAIICKAREMSPWNLGPNEIDLGVEKNPGVAQLSIQYELQKNTSTDIPECIVVTNTANHFDHKTPYFELECKEKLPEKIWWQISLDRDFDFLIPNFQGIQDFTSTITLDAWTDTFFNPREVYYFRTKALLNGHWSDWSSIFEFTVSKPEQVKNPEFKKLGQNQYQISWEPEFDTHYLIFASNAFDFMPSIYASQQYNIIDQYNGSSDQVNNLFATTSECSIKIGTEYAFYRIIAERQGQYSIPSPIIRIYDYGLSIPRSVMQAVPSAPKTYRAERMAFPPAYAHVQESLRIHSYTLDRAPLLKEYYVQSAHVDPTVWDYIKPFFLPENHPIKHKLDRLFSKRVTQNTKTLKNAGFLQPDPMKFSKTIVSKNKNVPGYMFKLFCDDQKGISDWQRCFYRVTGAIYIQDALNRYNINHLFVVPTKWIYPLPDDPSPPTYLDRKNFIVVENLLDIYTGKENNRMWKSPIINQVTLTWIYFLLQELGLSDSAYNFNMPISKDNRISFIDTEHHHQWPVPLFKLWPYLSPEMRNYWNEITAN